MSNSLSPTLMSHRKRGYSMNVDILLKKFYWHQSADSYSYNGLHNFCLLKDGPLFLPSEGVGGVSCLEKNYLYEKNC